MASAEYTAPRVGSRRPLGTDVFTAAVERLTSLYLDGHRLVVSVSGGKDSGVCLELAIIAAERAGCLPVQAVTRDEEIVYPGSIDYLDRVSLRPEVVLHRYLVPRPVVNVFNRASPYYWPFDDHLPPSEWTRRPPDDAIALDITDHPRLTTPQRYPAAVGKETMVVLGLRVQESHARMYGLFSAGSFITKPDENGVRAVRPIYDWTDGDVWLAHKRYGWDYNSAYSDLARLGVPRHKLRVAPPAMNAAGAALLPIAAKAWPQWFASAADRLPGLRQGALFGRAPITPRRRSDESWQDCFARECLGDQVPDWIKERAAAWRDKMLSHHRSHADLSVPFPQTAPCHHCDGNQGSWRTLTISMWNGDPTSVYARGLPEIQPEFFRAGSGRWRDAKARW